MVAFKNSNLERILKTYSEVDRNLYRTKISRKTKWKLIHERTFADFGRVSNETVFIHLGTHEVKTIGKVDGALIDKGSKVAAFRNTLVAQSFVFERNRNP